MNTPVQRIAVTAGEPAGIGPDLVVGLCSEHHNAELVFVADPELLADRARLLDRSFTIKAYDPTAKPQPSRAGEACVAAVPLGAPVTPGVLDPGNGPYVLKCLQRAGSGCLQGEFAAVVTAPVQKSVICESGTPFTGHTEFFAELCGVDLPVMLLCADTLRVALVTTHIALADVPAAITAERLRRIILTLDADLRRLFGCDAPHIAVLGLNPHAGESGQLGREETAIIEPVLATLRQQGLRLSGPLPADTAFNKGTVEQFDAVLAMYHDQGLPVLKHAGFGRAVNVTLGLPIIRTSVDHGTALELAGTGRAHGDSLRAALSMAGDIAARRSRQPL